ncbi:MAG: pantetheine-phosphate adenylyltransferase [Bacteroidetes bacterium]|nr:pantetheine-phosphate adenylyltransferase [Bacteroidota bacterium]
MRIAVFPGTFDPITRGHEDIIRRAAPLFDQLIVGIGVNSSKQPMFELAQRIQWIKDVFQDEIRVKVDSYEGLTVEYCKKVQANYIIRGVRSVGDFEYERAIADMNHMLSAHIETIFFACAPQYSSYSSTIVRDVIRNKGDYSKFIPQSILIPE